MPIDIDAVPESTYVRDSVEDVRHLWVGLLAGPIIYAVYFIIGYMLAEAACRTSFLNASLGGYSALLVVVEGLTLLSGLATLAAAVYSYRLWRADHGQDARAAGAHAFMAFGSLLLNLLFFLIITVTGIGVWFVNFCG